MSKASNSNAQKVDPETHKLILQYRKQGLSERKIQKILEEKHGIKLSHGRIGEYFNLAPAEPLDPTSKIQADKKVGEFNWREWVPSMQKMQELKRMGSSSQDTTTIALGDGKQSVALACYSDQHMGAWSTDYNELLKVTDEFMKTEGLYIALLGDYGQYAIKLRNVLEVSDNLLPPEQQTQFLESYFDEIWSKVAFATWDNHAVERQEKQAGESSTKKLLSKRVVYFNGIGHVDIRVGEQVYKGCVSHTFRGRSMLNPVHGAMRYMRFEGIDREWAMAGDSHVPGMAKYTDGACTRSVVNSGSLQLNSGYAKRYFSLTTHPVYPILVFHADSHQITPFWSVKEWLSVRDR